MIMGVIQFSCHVPWRPLSSVWQAFISNGKRSVIWEPICSGLCVHLTSEWYAVESPLFSSILLGLSSPFNVRGRSITYITLLNITSCKTIGKNLAASIDSIVLFFFYANCNQYGSGERMKSLWSMLNITSIHIEFEVFATSIFIPFHLFFFPWILFLFQKFPGMPWLCGSHHT